MDGPNPAKALMQRIFDGLAQGDAQAFRDSLADDFTWTIMGSTAWSRAYRGKDVVMKELMRPLFARFATRYTNTASRFIADGEWVAVECQGHVTTKGGKPYDNRYCWICRVEGGRLKEVVEYMDTQLVATALGAP